MNTIIVYESKTGFTRQYAEWMAEELGCKCAALKEVSKETISSYEQVIFGGWIMGGMIVGLNKLCAMTTPAAVFAVGLSPAYEEVIAAIKEQNKLESAPIFYMQGGLHFDKLGFPLRIMLKALKKSTAKKENRNRQEDFMAEMLATSFDHADRKQMQPLIEFLEKRMAQEQLTAK